MGINRVRIVLTFTKNTKGYQNNQSLARSQQRVHTQPRRASRKCFFIIGGYSRTVEKFDSFSQTCDSFTTAQMSFARSGHAVASIGGLIYAIGGENDSLIYDTVECYDPVLNSWSVVAPLTAPRVACGVCVVEDFIFVMGGWVGSEIAENIERYDPDLDQWVVVGKVETKRFHLGVAEMDGLIYVAGKFIVIFIIICVAQLCLNRVFSMDFINSQPSISNHAGCHNISFI